MASTTSIPSRVTITVRAKGASPEGLCVCLRFEMRSKNTFSYVAFLDSQGTASASREELLRVFDEERHAFIMDYDDPRIAFSGKITAKLLSPAELKSALEAFQMFRGKLSFPDNYEERLKAALRRGQKPDECQLEMITTS